MAHTTSFINVFEYKRLTLILHGEPMPRTKPADYNAYMKAYMRDYRKRQRELIQWARENRRFVMALPKPKGTK